MGKLNFLGRKIKNKAVEKAQENKAELNKITRIIVFEIERCEQCPDFGNLTIQQSGTGLVQCRKRNALIFEFNQPGLLDGWYKSCTVHPEKEKIN